MIRYIARRLLGAVGVVFCVFVISFVIMRAAPGSPFDSDKAHPPKVIATHAETTGMAEAINSPVGGVVAELRVRPGLEISEGDVIAVIQVAGGAREEVVAKESAVVFQPVRTLGETIQAGDDLIYVKTGLVTQMWTTLVHYAQGDFGTTFASRGERTVAENIRETLPVSMELGLYALFIALALGITAGLIAGLKQNTVIDHSVMSAAMVGISVPSIVLGPLLIVIFIMKLEWLPAYGGWELGLTEVPGKKLLPALTLGLGYAAYFARLTRGGMLEVVRQDWIRTARAKGMPDRIVVLRHALKGAILPAVTFLGPAMAHLMVGSVVVEKIFNIPGISKYFIDSAIGRDYPMVMGVVVIYSVFLVLFNLVVDIAYAYLDPRVTYE